MSAPKRNSPCPCGSGKKYKKCCAQQPSLTAPGETADGMLSAAAGLEQAGQHIPAERRLRLVIEQWPGDYRAYWQLGLLLYRQQHLDEGLALMEQARALQPENERLTAELANRLLEQGQAQGARSILSQALASQPRSFLLQLVMGVCLEKMGLFAEAIDALKKAQKLNPHNAEAVAYLARSYRNNRQYREAEALLESFIASIEEITPKMDKLWSELGQVKDKLKQYDQAFAAFTRAGQLTLAKPETRALDSRVGDREIQGYQSWVLDGGLQRIEPFPSKEQGTHIFFVGFPRSGTTLTEQIISSHSQINSSEERLFLWKSIKGLHDIYGHDKPITEILEQCTEFEIQQARDTYWQEVATYAELDGEVFVDKLPLNLVRLAAINVLFPSAKIIVALRDPRDVCLSCFFQSFSLNNAMKNFLAWPTTTAYYRKVMAYWLEVKSHMDLPFIEVKYEDTVTDLPSQARRILDFIGVDWEEGVLSYYEQTREKYVATPSYQAIREPVNTAAINRWKNYPEPMGQALDDLKPFIEAFSYQL